MKKFYFSILLLLMLPVLVLAQSSHRPAIDIMTNPQAWANRQANICVQVMTIPRVAVCLSGSFDASEAVQGNFLAQSSKWGFHAETRIFPFGEPRPLHSRNNLRPYEKRRQGIGCFGPKNNWFEKLASNLIKGIYIAPGYIHQEEKLGYELLPGKESPLTNFNYLIKQNGASLALGYQIRLWHITLGAGWSIQASKPKWTGPVDIFGDDLYTTTFPWKLNIQQGPRFEVGIYF